MNKYEINNYALKKSLNNWINTSRLLIIKWNKYTLKIHFIKNPNVYINIYEMK